MENVYFKRTNKLMAVLTSIVMCFVMFLIFPKAEIEVSASGVDNIAARADYLYNITWTAQTTVKGWRNNYTFSQGSTYHIPYGQPVTSGKYVCWGVSVDDFLSATQNASSVFYTTRSYYSGNSGSYSTYYAMDCSAFASYCWGLSSRTTTSGWSGLSVTSYGKCTSANVNKIQKGDALNLSGSHIVIVSDVTYDSSGNIAQVEITEQTPPEIKRSYYTASSLVSKYSSYTIYRYNKRDSVTAPPVISTSSPNLDGNIETYYGGNGTVSVSGWAYDANDTNTRVRVDFYLGDESGVDPNLGLGSVTAQNDRGDGTYTGYNATFTTSAKGTYYVWAAIIANGSTKWQRSGAAVTVTNASLDGNIETYYGGNGTVSVSGWAYDANDTNTRVRVDFYLGDENGADSSLKLGSATAQDDRGDGTYTGYNATFTTSAKGTYYVWAAIIANGSTKWQRSGAAVTINEKVELLTGDCNVDGVFSIADVVMLQKWILNVPNATLNNWKMADISEDDKINVIDLCLMKNMLINS